MSYQATLKRYISIISKLERFPYSSLDDLRFSLQNRGIEISKRTIERSIQTLRNDFGVEICYNKSEKGYWINKEESVEFSDFLGFLKHAHSANHLADTLRNGKDALKYIHFDSYTDIVGTEHIQRLLQAIKGNSRVELTYKNLEEQTVYNAYLNPELLKEYQNRWYVLGYDSRTDKPKTYALDRITRVFICSRGFVRKLPDADEVFENIIGLNLTDREPIEILLSFRKQIADDIRDIPIHHSQKIIEDNKHECIISIFVKPNFDLKRKIQSFGREVKVVKPFFLMDRI